jgi:hypothetical protein
MILPDFILPSRVNQRLQYSGIDSPESCLDKEHFKLYPYPIEYCYNSRGFRDTEWPDTLNELKDAIWCVGDSFTVGIGSPVEHTWPYILQQQTGCQVINISMDGASNEWIARKCSTILKIINPKNIIVQWSYVERRENFKNNSTLNRYWLSHYENVKGTDWPPAPSLENYSTLPDWILKELAQHDQSWKNGITDEELKLRTINSTVDEDISNTLCCIDQIESIAKTTKIIHSFIPEVVPRTYELFFKEQLKMRLESYISQLSPLDIARDGHHYDVLTSCYLVDQVIPLLN